MGDTLITCEGGEVKETLCGQAWCAQHGRGNSLGCGYTDGNPQCKCEVTPECYPGEGACAGQDSAKECIDGKWSDLIACDTYCVQQAYDLSLSCTQVGKTAVCDCRWECNPGKDSYLCSQNGLGIFQCEDEGAWSPFYDCDDVCTFNGYKGSIGCQWFPNDAQFKCSCY